jgi:short-subunit dehydrogenase
MTKPHAVVTGGSAGIGLELSRLLPKDGYDLFISGSATGSILLHASLVTRAQTSPPSNRTCRPRKERAFFWTP